MLRVSIAVAAAFLVVGVAAAQPPAQQTDDEPLFTKVYDLKPVLTKGAKDNADGVIELILKRVAVGELRPGTDGPQLVERGDCRLEVRAAARAHAAVSDLLASLLRPDEVAVDVKARVIELDAEAFEKWHKAVPASGRGRVGSPVVFATPGNEEEKGPTDADTKAHAAAAKMLAAGKVVQDSAARFPNGKEGTVSARRSVLTFPAQPRKANPPAEPPLYVKEGFGLVGLPVVSDDRRYVRLRLTEQSTLVTGTLVRRLAEVNGEKVGATAPDTEDRGATGSATVPDGGRVVFRLAYAPKDKVWLVVVEPTIYLRSEEEIERKDEKSE